MSQAAKVFDIPVISTQQVNFGAIDESILASHHAGVKVFEKKTFSMLDHAVKPYLLGLTGRKSAVLYGVEAHVCVRQTALDLLELNYDVHLVVDAVSSMNYHDRNIAIVALTAAGAQIISFQSLMFELMKTVEHPRFKEVLNIVKGNPRDQLDLYYFNPYAKL